MKHYIYKTTNLVNGRYYIGKHSSDSIQNDMYLGSGKILNKAIQKYNRTNFSRQILFQFQSENEAYQKEKFILQQLLNDPLCYNIAPGGNGNSQLGLNKVVIINADGKYQRINKQIYDRNIHTSVNSNHIVVKDVSENKVKRITIKQFKLNPHKYIHVNKNYAIFKNKNTLKNERLSVKTEIDNTMYTHVNKGFVLVLEQGAVKRIAKTDPRYLSGQVKSKETNIVRCYDQFGNFYCLDKNSSQWKSGKYKGINKDKIWCHNPITMEAVMVNDLQDVPVGYKHGRGRQYNKTHKGNKFMSRGGIIKSVPPTEVQTHLQNGWIYGFKQKEKKF